MLDLKTHSRLVEATASVMRWQALATVSASTATVARGLSIWSEILQRNSMRDALPASLPAGMWWFVVGTPWWLTPPGWAASRSFPNSSVRLAQAPEASVAVRQPDPGVASYRSAGGHAVAQVTVGSAGDNGQAPPPAR